MRNGKHVAKRNYTKMLVTALALVLVCCMAVGGTLAWLKANTSTVENTFKAGDIKYTLKLEPNAAKANEKYEDSNVSMPTALDAKTATDLSVIFTPDKAPELTGYTFDGWHYDKDCAEDYPHVDENGAITVNYGDEHDSNEHANKVEITLYAVWLLNSYTVTFDYNIGYGTTPTKEVLYGEEYGVLPPYLTTETENLFKGWYTAKEGGTRVYPDTLVPHKEDHTLWAHWDPSPANDIIKDLVVHSSADDDKDGVADDIHLEFTTSLRNSTFL